MIDLSNYHSPVTLPARRDRLCESCGGTIRRGEVFVCLEGHGPTGRRYAAVHRGCYEAWKQEQRAIEATA